jgi:hypothetical protein
LKWHLDAVAEPTLSTVYSTCVLSVKEVGVLGKSASYLVNEGVK